jgi:DNA-directed RNA polymerase specialized sigma24 family protein
MRDIEERSYDDIAETLDLPVGTLSTYLTRARRQLRHDLGNIHDIVQAYLQRRPQRNIPSA